MQSWERKMEQEHSTSLISDYTKSYFHKDSMVAAQTQKIYITMKQYRKPRDTPHTYGHLIFDKGGKNIQCKKADLFKWHQEILTAACKRMKLNTF